MDKSQTNNKTKKDEVVGIGLNKPKRRNSSSNTSISGNNNKFVLVAAKPKKTTRTTTATTSSTMAPRVSRSTAAAAAAAVSASSKGLSSPAVKAKKIVVQTKVVSLKTASKGKASVKPMTKKETTKKSVVENDEIDKKKKTATKATSKAENEVDDDKKTSDNKVENTKVADDTDVSKKSKSTKKTEDDYKDEADEEKKVADTAATKAAKKKAAEVATKNSDAASTNAKTKGKKASAESGEKPKDETETKESKKVVKPDKNDNEKEDDQETADKTNKKKTKPSAKDSDEVSKKKTKKETNKDTKEKKDTNKKIDIEQQEQAPSSTNVQLDTNSGRGEEIKKIVVGSAKSELKKEYEGSSTLATSSKPDNKNKMNDASEAKNSNTNPNAETEKSSPSETEQVATTKDSTASAPTQSTTANSETVQTKTDSIVIKPLPKVLLELSKAKRKSATSGKKTSKKNKKTSPNRPVNWVAKYITPKPTPTPTATTPLTLTKAKGTKKKGKKDPKAGKPSRPLSAYNLFFKEERLKWLAEQRDLGPEAIAAAAAAPTEENADGTVAKAPRALERMAKEIGKRWKALSPEEKQPYVVLAAQEMKRYQGEKVQFVQSKRTSGVGIIAAPALSVKSTKGRKKKADMTAAIGATTAPSIPAVLPAVADAANAEPLKKKRGRKPKNADPAAPTTAAQVAQPQPDATGQPPVKKAKKSTAAARHSTGTALLAANNDVKTAAAAGRHSIGGTAGLPGDDVRNSFGTGVTAASLDANRTAAAAANLKPLQHPTLNANANMNGGFYEQQVQQRLQQQALANQQQQLRQGAAGNTFGLGTNLNAPSNLAGVAGSSALSMKKPAITGGMGAPDLLNSQQYNLLGRGPAGADLNVNNLSDAQLELLLERRRLQQNMLYDQLLMGNNAGVTDSQSLGVALGGLGQTGYGGGAGNLASSSIGPNSDLLMNQQGNSSDVQNLFLSQQIRQQELQQQQLLTARANNARASLDGLSNPSNYNSLLQQQELQLEMQLRQRLMMNNQQQLNAAGVGRGYGNQNLLNPHHTTDLSPYMMSNNGIMDPQDLRRPSLVSLSTDEGNVGANPNGLMMNNHGVNPNSGNNDTLRRLLLAQQQQQQQQQQQLQQGQPYMDNMYNPNPIHYQHGAEY